MIRLFFTDEGIVEDTILINIPDEKVWKLYTQTIDENGYDDCSLYLQIETEKAICVRCDSNSLELNNDIISEVHKEIISGKTDINIDDIETKLISMNHYGN